MVDRWREYRLVKLTGWSRAEIAGCSALDNDWLLIMDDVAAQVSERIAKKASKKAEQEAGKTRSRRRR